MTTLKAIKEIKKANPSLTQKDILFFLATPNSYIGDKQPVTLIQSDFAHVLSLAHRFANPAEVF